MEIRFTQSARKHRIGRGSVRHVMAHTTPIETTTAQGNRSWRYIGVDERSRELEVVAVEIQATEPQEHFLLVIHVMPTRFREGGPDV